MVDGTCKVCHKRPEIADERYGRCEACAKSQRIAFRFRLGPDTSGRKYIVKSGELSPHALKQKWHTQLAGFGGKPSIKTHLTLHEVEMVVAKDRIESVRISPDLEGHVEEVVPLLLSASERADSSW